MWLQVINVLWWKSCCHVQRVDYIYLQLFNSVLYYFVFQLAEVVSERDLLKQQQSQHATKGIRELEKINRVRFHLVDNSKEIVRF